ncbi:hypothetical protein NDU88_004015 [Pleurodeles waltl]|uniref:Uncharacterized protein n=1 Tax=Pleurodeles waltl TaxID=8319 RepID=A0AAV7MCT2_PLEWA|nr:hypothetical protein NDU88_004015 [Pleurodeles waltl]
MQQQSSLPNTGSQFAFELMLQAKKRVRHGSHVARFCHFSNMKARIKPPFSSKEGRHLKIKTPSTPVQGDETQRFGNSLLIHDPSVFRSGVTFPNQTSFSKLYCRMPSEMSISREPSVSAYKTRMRTLHVIEKPSWSNDRDRGTRES